MRLTLATYGDRCHLCLQRGATTADHVIPRVRGGDDSIENLRPAHSLCNSRRGDRTIAWFRARYCPWLVKPITTVTGLEFFKPTRDGHPAPARPIFPDQNKSGRAEGLENGSFFQADRSRS